MSGRQGKQEEIRKAAVDVIAEYGYHYATTDKIAEAANVAVGTIYNYFRNKEDILEYIFQREVDKRFRYYEVLSAQSLPAVEKLHLLLQRHFSEIMAEPTLGRIMIRERYAPADRQLGSIKEFIRGVPFRIESLLKDAVKQDEIKACDTSLVATALWGSVEAVVAKAIYTDDSHEQQAILSGAAHKLVDLYLQGLKK